MCRHCLVVVTILLLMIVEITMEARRINLHKKKHKHYVQPYLPQNVYLGKRSLCDSTEYTCATGKCISADEVCDTHKNCLGGDDENNCPTDCTGQHQFKCESSQKCIGIVDKCDGYPDCPDYSDEISCDINECLAGRFKCATSNECIKASYVCDKEADCEDGSDEKNCVNGSCMSSQWRCADGDRCIPQSFVCDGDVDCTDRSDEAGCSCSSAQFKCYTGACIPKSYACDGEDDCGDSSDELNCPNLPSNRCVDVMTYEDCFRMNETTHPICLIYDDGNKFCRKFCGFCST